MILIVGLGNPGKEFFGTRHNLGFEVLDQFAKENEFPDFKFSKKFNADVSKKGEIILAKPRTFMNNSGKTVKPLTTYYSLPTTNLFVVHDDLDLPLGKIKISKGRGSAGHKGVQSIIGELKTKDFVRFRIGIEKEPVLEKFSKEEQNIIKDSIKNACLEIKKGLTAFEFQA
ncbi:MAG: aminoacyl-tRNA hydrolase [Candidatus Nealsonbacteria bacterium]|nr:aminoacyl-tRNA hydrolase [Candidatus Nealsonbacteria bacterium]